MIRPPKAIWVLLAAPIFPAMEAAAQPVQYARVRTGFGDPTNINQELMNSNFAELEGVATEASQQIVFPPPDFQRTEVTSVGSSVVMARARPGSLGASVYNGYIVGTDTYYGYADARTEDDIMITGGPPNQTVTVAVGSIVNGGLGIYGSDAAASARAYYRFQGNSGITGDARIFEDSAHGEEVFDTEGNLLPPHHVYDYSARNDYRYVHVDLDGTGSGGFRIELWLEASAFEEGDENLYQSAAAADYGDTINAHLQPWSEDFTIMTASGEWQVRPFGTALSSSPPPVTLTLEQLGIPEPSALLITAIACLSCSGARMSRRPARRCLARGRSKKARA